MEESNVNRLNGIANFGEGGVIESGAESEVSVPELATEEVSEVIEVEEKKVEGKKRK